MLDRRSSSPAARCLLVLSSVVALGCQFDVQRDAHGIPVDVDGGADAAACPTWPANHTHFDPCSLPAPDPGVLTLDEAGVYVLSTDDGQLLSPAGTPIDYQGTTVDDAWLMSLQGLQLAESSTVRVVGGRPLIIAVWDSAILDGTIDVSSGANRGAGAGANPGACAAQAVTDGAQDDVGGGGGGGGGFGSPGGNGGDGRAPGETGGDGGDGGMAVSVPADEVRGGCDGGAGGDGNGSGGAGAGGAGGGAVQISAQHSLQVAATIQAGGQGGGGADGTVGARGGGGGGGSGGYIGLESAVLDVAGPARLTANGGGGGSGCDALSGEGGMDGLSSGAVALGGRVDCDGSDGGNGGAAANGTNAVNGASDNRGGGGGGGGVGFVIVRGDDVEIHSAATISPPITRL